LRQLGLNKMEELKRAPASIGKMTTIFSDRRGHVVGANKDRLYERPFMLNTNPPNTTVAMPTPNQGSNTVEMRLSAEGPLQLTNLNAKKTNIQTPGTGTISFNSGTSTTAATGAGTHFTTELNVGDTIIVAGASYNVAMINSQTSLTVSTLTPFSTTVSASAFTILKRYDVCLLQLATRDGVSSPTLMNNWIHRDCLAGSQGQPYPLPDALYADETQALNATFQDISGVSVNANLGNGGQLTMSAAKYSQLQSDPKIQRIRQRLQNKQMLSLPYWFTFDSGFVTLEPFGYQEAVITIPEDSHFEIHQLSYAFGPGVTGGQFAVNIVDLAKGESIINAPSGRNYMIPYQLLFGQNGYPYRYPEPVTVFAGQQLSVKLQETGGNAGSPTLLYIALGGKKVPVRMWS
jgi:hypothetical protein